MKRPLPLYFVAAWCFLSLAVQVSNLSRLVAPYLAERQASAEVRNTLSGVGGVLVIWHVVQLIHLKSFNRRFPRRRFKVASKANPRRSADAGFVLCLHAGRPWSGAADSGR